MKNSLLAALVVASFTTPSLAEVLTSQGAHKSYNHHTNHIQRWHHLHAGTNIHSGSNHGHSYVRNSGPRFNGPYWDR